MKYLFAQLSSFFRHTLSVMFLLGVFSISLASLSPVQAQTTKTVPLTTTPATTSANASTSATVNPDEAVSTPSAQTQQRIQEKTDKDITETTSKSKDKLIEALDQHPIGSLNVTNFLQHAIRRGITNGLPANIVVLLILFPFIASLIAFSRHVIGLKGFGIYTPAVLSVAFVSTGIINGIFLFLVVLTAAMAMKRIMKQLNLQYLPRTAMVLWGVSIFMLLVLIGFSFLPASTLLAISIFPILIIILLSENFMESQLAGSQSEAIQLTLETLVTATLCSVLIGAEQVQQYVILQPEFTLFLVAVINILVGRYAGLRLLEWIRFRSIIE